MLYKYWELLYLHAIFNLMKRILVLFFCLIFQNILNAQIHEIGVFIGGSNFIGDVGKTNYVSPNELAVGILYKWKQNGLNCKLCDKGRR